MKSELIDQNPKEVPLHPFASLLGIELVRLDLGESVCRLTITEKHLRVGGVAHGGVTASLIDSATAYAVHTQLGERENTVTIDLTLHFIRPITKGEVTAEATVIRGGRSILVVVADVFDELGKLSATSISTYARLSERPIIGAGGPTTA